MRPPRTRLTLALVGLASTATLALAGCSGGGSTDGTPTVVTSTDVWASVASAVAGDKADVTALYTSSEGDPHEFEPSASDTAKAADAQVVLINGGHYDSYLEDAPKADGATVVNAFDLLSDDEHEHAAEHGSESEHADDHAESGEGHAHNHGETNEHVFYDLVVVGQVADKVADALAEKSPDNAQFFRDNAKKFTEQIDGLRAKLAQIKRAHNGTDVAQTEPLAGYMLTEAGLKDVAPAGFTEAVEGGQSPSAADRAAMEDLLRTRTAKTFVYNTQAVDPVTEALLALAKSANVPVVEFTETLPTGVTSYIDWQSKQIDALSGALTASGNAR
ncbi:metal ABC transporter solute-binding protein, Zn/Mn family [Gordonia soli]|uniref:Putative ABC transporter substrate-binding protein n=1 Tax=Gordonia soli NBRC 108243 TaxID=1223545 RepID=M0QIB2_9ACTN|nr:zinc ABC transporter substrate-binding protein [Gordonia soli]GAC68036.1 putative ABC transporter substrate-binding protein [Gordonia soli NBRC 108243]